MASMRDVLLNELFEKAKNDRNIVVLSADFSAPATDRWKLELPNQYIFTGISEQNTILTATGLALEGKKVFCYAIAPFLTMRCFEQIRLYLAGMNLPIVLVGVGAGISYEDSGYTHYAVEDIAILRTLPNFRIFQPCDNVSVKGMLNVALDADYPIYFRLDRFGADEICENASTTNGENGGMRVIQSIEEITLLATGNMVQVAIDAAKRVQNDGISVGVIDVCQIPLNEELFKTMLVRVNRIITLEEHTLPGGFGSYILELISDLEMGIKVKRIGFDFRTGYTREYGGRPIVHQQYGMDVESVVAEIKGE